MATIIGTSGNNTIFGTLDRDLILGLDGNDSLLGSGGNDTLIGGNGIDTLNGGIDRDMLEYSGALFSVRIDFANGQVRDAAGLLLDLFVNMEDATGSAFADTISGLGDGIASLLQGLGGNDSLVGGAGDILDGGTGDDRYMVTDASVQVLELPGGGRDTIIAAVDFTLADQVEDGFADVGGVVLTGNELGNLLQAATGGTLAQRLVGLGGDDTLDGGGGADTLEGGAGFDVYIVDNTGDVVIDDAAGEGRVLASTSFTLPGTLATLILRGHGGLDGVIDGTGNAAANTIIAQLGPFHLQGLAGNDTLFSDLAADTLEGGEGDDLLDGAQGSDLLDGGEGADLLRGGEHDDTLDGGAGADTLEGGLGNDLYRVGAGDVVLVDPGGSDRVIADVSFTLVAGVEVLMLDGGGADIDGTGATGREVLFGNTGANRLSGLNGADTLSGGEGRDTLSGGGGDDDLHGGAGIDQLRGGGGRDLFRFDAPGEADRVVDFTAGDRIGIDLVGFDPGGTSGMAPSALAEFAGAFAANLSGRAEDAATRLIYETDTGKLWWDGDGTGGEARVLAAVLAGAPAVTAADILLF